MNATEIKAMLASKAADVCRLLLPAGKQVKNQWHCGSVKGEPGDSLKVHLDGQYAGYWKDFGNEADKGSLLDLWMKVKGVDFKTTLDEAAKWLGVDLRAGETRFAKETRQPTAAAGGVKADWAPARESGAVWRYLTEKRKLTPETLKKFGVGETRDGKAMVFPYRSEDGKRVVMAKFIALDRDVDGGKRCWTTANTSPCLFGKENIGMELGLVFITEGEIDAMTISQLGYPAVSVPYGAKAETKDGKNPNDPWISADYDFLERFQEIYLAFDSDEPGRKAAASLVKRLGVERCLLVRWPDDAKDVNELLMQNRISDVVRCLQEAKSLDPEHLRSAEEFREETYERFFPKDGQEPGIEFLWPFPFRIRSGELTVWTGFSGHGKSQLLGHLMVHLLSRGEKAFIASMEMPASMTLQNLWRQASGFRKPEQPDVDGHFRRIFDWFIGKLWIYDRMGDVDAREVLSVMNYTARRYGVRQFVVDSLCKLSVASDDYDGQKRILNDFCALAKDMGVHIHLVAHSKKPQHNSESNIPGKYEVSGSAAITDLAWNGVTVWRNKEKEQRLDPDSENYEMDPEKRSAWTQTYDAFCKVWKQRMTGQEPAKRLWFDRESWQFHDQQEVRRIFYVK